MTEEGDVGAVQTVLDRHVADHAYAYASGVLVPEEHHRIVADIDFFAAKAGVTPEDLWTHAKETCNDRERRWVRQVVCRGSVYGYAFVGGEKAGASYAARCRAMVAGAVRNFCNARYMLCEELWDRLRTGDRDVWDVHLVAVPDLIPASGVLPEHRASAIASWLLGRMTRRVYTAVGFPSAVAFDNTFGAGVSRQLRSSFWSTTNGLED